ncbi:putative ochratoxin a non-ribosomal peptide synthetase protein [Botrytis cinerea BcDW1]|uniref:Putative ochratoxin a non-ribosomal peptide synthetase protein n=1 Tax=Botryotinia fuckeliana (strain BcDW1) TaxID=1290391 RepID=M7U2A1_BOTF1|nr:putative ochratoxin a non-ribosomal peptide synthetase protein [Botrytis cinerea BcDW1]
MVRTHEQVAQWQNSLAPHIVERLARETPDNKYGEWVSKDSVVVITYAQLANVIDGLAWLIVEQLGGPGRYGANPEVLAYVGTSDVRYSALVLAAAKAGYTLFVTSPRNSPAAHCALFDHLKCQTLIISNPIPPPANVILDAVKPMSHFMVPSVKELLNQQYPHYVLSKTFEDLRQTPIVVMHTSGTTGFPKPLIWTHETCTQVLNANACEAPNEILSVQNSFIKGKRVIVTLPPFHVSCSKSKEGTKLIIDQGALLAQLFVGAIPYGNIVIAPVATAIPTAQGVVNVLKQSPAEVANTCAIRSSRVGSASNPEVSGAIVIGAQRFQAAFLIGPASATLLTTAEQATLIERIWPSIEESNRKAPAHVRLEKSFVLVLPADRRLIRAAKGTFTRAPSISQYTEEIEKLYNNADLLSNDDDYPNGDTAHYYTPTGPDATTRLIRQHVRSVTASSNLDDADNFFDRGMDSLQSLQLTRALRRSFQRPDFAISTIYQNSTVSQLRTAILTPNKNEQDELEIMEALLTTYRTIGSYLLQALLNRDGIANVFCLNCGEDGGKAKQRKIFTASGFATTKLSNRVTFIKADLESPSLGMDEHAYKSLSGEIDLIIHAAWPVNFNLALSAFRSQFAGIINLLTLAASTNSTTRFVFVSSIAAVEGHTAGPALEEIIFSLKTSAPFGYARAKFLSELLVDAAGQHLGETISTTIIRIGQIAGPVLNPGLWNPREWFPSVMLSSLYLGQIPNSLGPRFDNVDFIPVDLLGDFFVDLVTTRKNMSRESATTVSNLRNPQLVTWSTLLRDLVAIRSLEILEPEVWLDSLRMSREENGADGDGDGDGDGDRNVDVEQNPAVKLLDFLTGLLKFRDLDAEGGVGEPMLVERALDASPKMRGLEAVRGEWIGKWMSEWMELLGASERR